MHIHAKVCSLQGRPDETKKGYEGVSKRKCGYRDASASRNVLDNDPRELELHKPVVQEYKAN